jgi:hypothetical protein
VFCACSPSENGERYVDVTHAFAAAVKEDWNPGVLKRSRHSFMTESQRNMSIWMRLRLH